MTDPYRIGQADRQASRWSPTLAGCKRGSPEYAAYARGWRSVSSVTRSTTQEAPA